MGIRGQQLKFALIKLKYHPGISAAAPCAPQAGASNKTKPGYILNLLALREASLSVSPPIPFWNFFNSMPYGAHGSQYDISEASVDRPHITLRAQPFFKMAQNLDVTCALLSDRSTFGAGAPTKPRTSVVWCRGPNQTTCVCGLVPGPQPNHTWNPDSVIQNLNHIY